MTMNLELYRTFYWAAKEKNLSRAAERLYVTQPSVSHAIKQLEEELSITLFHRGPKGVTLTDEGNILFEHVEQALVALESAERLISETASLLRGELRIGGGDSLIKYYLLSHLSSFCSDYPQIHLNLVNGTTSEIIQQVKSGRIDFGIVRLPIQDESLIAIEAVTVEDCFVAGPKFAHLAATPISLADLRQYPIILFTKTSTSRRFIEEFAASHGLSLEPEIELASVDLLIEFAKAGLGISFVTRQFVRNECENGSLVELQLIEPIPSRKVGIVFLKNRRLSPATNIFINKYLQIPDS
jgi:LysR family cyn operon transcriptional activator